MEDVKVLAAAAQMAAAQDVTAPAAVVALLVVEDVPVAVAVDVKQHQLIPVIVVRLLVMGVLDA